MEFVDHRELGFVEWRCRGIVLEDETDVRTWSDEVDREFSALGIGRRVPLLIDLAGLQVRPKASVAFGRARSDLLAKFTTTSVRYGADAWTKVSIETSRVLHGTEANVCSTRDEAIACLQVLRRRSAY
jgi:hypothetical protein